MNTKRVKDEGVRKSAGFTTSVSGHSN